MLNLFKFKNTDTDIGTYLVTVSAGDTFVRINKLCRIIAGYIRFRTGFQYFDRTGPDAQKAALAPFPVYFNFSSLCHSERDYTSG
jgi:hypothetical protein